MPKQPNFRRAVSWAYAMSWGGKGFAAAFSFLLAAILGPGISAWSPWRWFISPSLMILDQGLFAAVIQRKDLKLEHLDAVFWLNVVISVALIALTFLISGWWATINHLPELGAVIRVLSSIILIEALAKTQTAVCSEKWISKTCNPLKCLGRGRRGCGAGNGLQWIWSLGSGRSESLRRLHSAHSALETRPLAASAALLRGCLGRSAGVFDGHLRHQGRRFAYAQADAASMGYSLARSPWDCFAWRKDWSI